ncbi:MAG: AgmX/PglI C-terminal domain-containing protein [Labilithrix sp.]|nr:AgmX/PglI C-terminal domain-containing protein [Labilithrix sp.]
MKIRAFLLLSVVTACAACGASTPPPPPLEPTAEEPRERKTGGLPSVSQELGSIDPKKVEQTFKNLQVGAIETCHKQGRDRIEFLTGDVKVFLRIDGSGKVKYGFFEQTSIGDRETEKCILGALANASWPKPEGGEAEVRSGFGWGSGGEREPTSWSSDKVTAALADAKDVKSDVGKCKSGVTGDFVVTAYVEHDDSAPAKPAPAKRGKKGDKDKGGKFKAIGVAPPSKEGAEKIDCIVDALKPLDLPSPGSYAAKVTFTL